MGPGKAPGPGAVFGALRIGIGQGRQVQAHRQFEHRADAAKRQGVRPAHETGADQANAKFVHNRSCRIIVLGKLCYGINIR